jgi:hypothetical protein
MNNPVPFSLREILEVTLLIAARYIPEQMKQDMEESAEAGPSSAASDLSTEDQNGLILLPAEI